MIQGGWYMLIRDTGGSILIFPPFFPELSQTARSPDFSTAGQTAKSSSQRSSPVPDSDRPFEKWPEIWHSAGHWNGPWKPVYHIYLTMDLAVAFSNLKSMEVSGFNISGKPMSRGWIFAALINRQPVPQAANLARTKVGWNPLMLNTSLWSSGLVLVPLILGIWRWTSQSWMSSNGFGATIQYCGYLYAIFALTCTNPCYKWENPYSRDIRKWCSKSANWTFTKPCWETVIHWCAKSVLWRMRLTVRSALALCHLLCM